MGRGMCVNLVKKGGLSKPLIVQNRTRTRSDKMVADLGHEKVEAVDTPDEAVKRSDIIFTCLGMLTGTLGFFVNSDEDGNR